MKPWQRDQLQRALEQRREVLTQELGGDELQCVKAVATSRKPTSCATRRSCATSKRRAGAWTTAVTASAPTAAPDIGFERLHAEPEAARCIDCQRRHEKTYRR